MTRAWNEASPKRTIFEARGTLHDTMRLDLNRESSLYGANLTSLKDQVLLIKFSPDRLNIILFLITIMLFTGSMVKFDLGMLAGAISVVGLLLIVFVFL